MRKSTLVGLVVGLLALLPIFDEAKSAAPEVGRIVLTKNNTILLNDEVTGEAVAAVISKAKELDRAASGIRESAYGEKKRLYLFLNTPGGNIQSGLEMIEALNGIGRPVDTITLFAASMGFQIAQNLGERYILKNGVLMSHRAKGGFDGEFGGTSPSQIESRYHLWNSRLTEMDLQTVKRTNGKQTLESYQKAYSSEMWLTGAESVAKGYADKIVTVKCDSSLDGATTHEASFLGIPITFDLDNCPINTTPMNVRMGVATVQRVNLDGKTQTTVTAVVDLDKFLSQGGGFGTSCLNSNASICASDPYLTLDRVREVKAKFLDQFTNKRDHVVPMTW